MTSDPDVRASPELWHEVADFLFREAELLDQRQFRQWLDCLTEDVEYVMPVRTTPEDEAREFSDLGFHFDENKYRLGKRIEYLESGWAWAEKPPSRTRHLVSNIRVEPSSEAELKVSSYVVVYRSRSDESAYEVLSAARRDLLRRVDGALKLARRRILVDQTTLGTRNLSFFL